MSESTVNDRANMVVTWSRVDMAVMWSRVDVALPKCDTWHCVKSQAREKEADGAETLGCT